SLALSAAGQGVVFAKARCAAVDEQLAPAKHQRLRGIAYRHVPSPCVVVGTIIHRRHAKGKIAGKERPFVVENRAKSAECGHGMLSNIKVWKTSRALIDSSKYSC